MLPEVGPSLPRVSPHRAESADLPKVVTASSIAFMMTAPAQTTTMSVFVDPLIASLGVSRSAVSTAYLVGTLGCAMLVPFLGRTIDRYGLRRATGAIALCFGVILIASSVATDIVGLTVAFVGIRVSGQGALQLAATTIVAAYLHERRGLGIGISSAFGAAGISLAPVLVERLVSAWGWRTVWIIEGSRWSRWSFRQCCSSCPADRPRVRRSGYRRLGGPQSSKTGPCGGRCVPACSGSSPVVWRSWPWSPPPSTSTRYRCLANGA